MTNDRPARITLPLRIKPPAGDQALKPEVPAADEDIKSPAGDQAFKPPTAAADEGQSEQQKGTRTMEKDTKDTVLGHIFHDPPPGGTGTTSAVMVDQARQAIGPIVQGLKVVTVDDKQKQEIAGHGEVGQRQRSQAYQRLLVRRPQLGERHGITPERFMRVIGKDASYDALTVTIREARLRVAGGMVQADAEVSRNVVTVLTYVDDQLQGGPSADAGELRPAFLAIGVGLDEASTQQENKVAATARGQKPLKERLQQAQEQSKVLPQIGRLEQGAQQGVDLARPPAMLKQG